MNGLSEIYFFNLPSQFISHLRLWYEFEKAHCHLPISLAEQIIFEATFLTVYMVVVLQQELRYIPKKMKWNAFNFNRGKWNRYALFLLYLHFIINCIPLILSVIPVTWTVIIQRRWKSLSSRNGGLWLNSISEFTFWLEICICWVMTDLSV